MSKPRTHVLLFAATVASVVVTALYFDTGFQLAIGETHDTSKLRTAFLHAGEFAGTLLSILLAHEFGHYFAARFHKVDASLPYFIPLPILSPFGTMGAVIRMQGTIARRAALLDIGASGPLCGLVLAIPLYAWGAHHSTLVVRETTHGMELGESILLQLLDRIAIGPIAPNMEVELSPMAFGAWAGLFVTMINLLPVGQLDGGHVAYALFGRRQDRFARIVHRLSLLVFAVAFARPIIADVVGGRGLEAFGRNAAGTLFWLVWFLILPVLGALSQRRHPETDNVDGSEKEEIRGSRSTVPIRERIFMIVALLVGASLLEDRSPRVAIPGWIVLIGGVLAVEATRGTLRGPHDTFDHPETNDGDLDGVRRVVGIVTLIFFILLFMPTPMRPT